MKALYFFICCIGSLSVCSQSDSSKYYYTIANQAFKERKFLVAEKNYLHAIKFDNKNFEAGFELAQTYVEMKKYGFGINYFKTCNTLKPNNPLVLENLANLCFNSHGWQDAVQYGKQCIEMKAGNKIAYIVAKSYYELEDFINSSKYLGIAATDDPKNADIPYTMSNIWLEMHNNKKALEMYEIALSLDTTKADWYLEAANLYQGTGDIKKALVYYEKAYSKGTDNDLDFQTTIGMAYLNNGKYEKGMVILSKVIAKKPIDKVLLNQIAYSFYNQKKYEDAIKWWDEILRIDKTDAKALYMIGIAFQKDGNKEKGNRLCDAAIAMDPTLASLKKEIMPMGMGL
jgi:tetratricopeptide (TPR) repeat protein